MTPMKWLLRSAPMCWVMLSACAGPAQIVQDPVGSAPSDLTVNVTVLSDALDAQRQPAHLRPSRYVLFPDGSLHHEAQTPVSDEKRPTALPPLTRVLTRRQVAEVWSLIEQLGLSDGASADANVNFRLVSPPRDEVVYVAGFKAKDERWSHIRRSGAGQPPDDAMAHLVRHLAALSWASDLPPRAVRILPKRYDFGPDPHERYRNQNQRSDEP